MLEQGWTRCAVLSWFSCHIGRAIQKLETSRLHKTAHCTVPNTTVHTATCTPECYAHHNGCSKLDKQTPWQDHNMHEDNSADRCTNSGSATICASMAPLHLNLAICILWHINIGCMRFLIRRARNVHKQDTQALPLYAAYAHCGVKGHH